MATANRVIKNTGFLYIKMGVTVFISLYSTRLILAALGVSDFGIYSVVGGAIAMMGFLNATMANATQRFMSFSLGEGDSEKCKQIFNISLLLHIVIAIITASILLIAMWPLFDGILNIPADRIEAAKIVYLCLVFSTVLTIVNVPYDAQINAHENMLYYAVVGVMESILKLTVALVCVHSQLDRLVLYGILMAIIPMVTLTIMKVYCHKHYAECVLAPRRYWSRSKAKEILSFSGWNLLTAISYLFTCSGIGIVLNHFFGTMLNTAQGIAQQLNGYMQAVSLQLVKAVNPVIVKKAGAGGMDAMNMVTIASCKFVTFLVLLFAVPVILEMPFVLNVWLEEVPEWAVIFCVLQLIQTIILQTAAVFSTAIYAQGDIKGYAIYKSIMNILPILLVYISFKMGGCPIWLYIQMLLVFAIGGNIVIVSYAKKLCGLSINNYFLGVIFPVCFVALVMFALGCIPMFSMEQGILRFLICCVLTTIGFLISVFSFGMKSYEKEMLMTPFRQLIKRIRKTY
ncbi:MAG: hypothetical protein K6G73_07755 [Marinilabiliaceae bacterium]|nr:hypothetical protein [Marinilabiliaceae bacterium]